MLYQAYFIHIIYQVKMGNEQPKKIGKANKNQIQIACLKAKIHLELMRDRKSQQIIKGQKQLVAKLNAKSRNKTQESLIMERVVNGLKYSQAVNQLISYAASLRAQAGFLADNIGNQQKLQPWLTSVHSLLYAADQLGLSSLNQFKTVVKALNDPMQAQKYINPEIKQMLSPTPTQYEVNVYILEMCQRNNIQIQQINSAGHKFNKQPTHPKQQNDKSFEDIQKQLAAQFQKQMNKPPSGFGNHAPSNGGMGGMGGMGGGGYNNIPPVTPAYYDKPSGFGGNVYNKNPYHESGINDHGPNYFTPSQVRPINPGDKPKQFTSYDDINIGDSRKTVQPIYPSMNPNSYQKNTPYQPQVSPTQIPQNQSEPNNNGPQKKTPTISQIMRDFDIK